MTSEAVALVLPAATLAFAVVRPRGLPEAAIAVPAAALVVVTGGLTAREALQEARDLAPTVAFLAAVLANLVNNLPAILLLPALAGRPGVILAALVGVNVGPDLTDVGSLATL